MRFWSGNKTELLVKCMTLGACIWVVQFIPTPIYDVLKPADRSFFSLYISGELHQVEHITQMLIAAFFSLFLDIWVVAYHLKTPPHPKFVMLPSRRISIFVHLVSGIAEITTGALAFTLSDPTLQKYVALIMSACSITHTMTAFYQTDIVFGAKGIMTPGYLYAITLHLAYALKLYRAPTSLLNLVCTFLVLHIYVWCRFFIGFFRLFHIFDGFHYTIAIAFSGLLLFPYVMGPIGNFAMLLVCIIYCALDMVLVKEKGKTASTSLFVEHERYALLTQTSIDSWKHSLAITNTANNGAADPDQDMAREVFNKHDTDKSGFLEVNEVHQIVASLQIPSITFNKMMDLADTNGDNKISFEEFYRFVWSLCNVKERLSKQGTVLAPAKTDQEKAKIIFDMLDLDRSGNIGLVELEMLLTQWGMPAGEAEITLTGYAEGKEVISFETFFQKMRPVWEFGVEWCTNLQ